MKKLLVITLLFTIWAVNSGLGQQFDVEKKDFKGRIAWSGDGNFNDEDDWAASPVALAIFAESGIKDKLVHFDYNCILPKTNKQWEKLHDTAVRGAAKRYGYREAIFHDVQKDLDAAVSSISRAINASSEDNPLYFILAGPMEVPVMGIKKADPEKRKFVTCISHNVWNDGYASGDLVAHNKRDVIPLGVNWMQITDQNQFLSTSPFGRAATDEEWEPWLWMRDSKDPDLRFLWESLRSTTRADCSDAGMAYFLITGDEHAEINKLKSLLHDKVLPRPVASRTVRMEAENFKDLKNFAVEYIRERAASQQMAVKYSRGSQGEIATEFKELHVSASSTYDVGVRIFSGSDDQIGYRLYVNGQLQDEAWTLASLNTWQTKIIKNVPIKVGDRLSIKVVGRNPAGVKIDYVELTDRRQRNPFTREIVAPLDDPDALPGQIIIAGECSSYLKYNGIPGAAYLCGPDNPETFLFDSLQTEMIQVMEQAGVTGFHCMMWRMKKGNMKGEGDDTHSPFLDNDPSKGLDPAVLNKWDRLLGLLEEAGITVHLDFYNDATDVELIGWKLDAQGNLHPDEHRFITGIVEKFKHRKNIIWGLEESANKLPRSRVAHFKKIAQVIAETDNHHHPIHVGFVVSDDPEGDDPVDPATPDDYRDDPNIGIVSWLHVHPHGDDFEAQYQEYLKYYLRDSRHFIVMTNETFRHPSKGDARSRKYVWSSAMAGIHNLNAYHNVDVPANNVHLHEDGFVASFMEKTDFYRMQPRNDLAAGSTKWVLANPGNSYILYTYDYQDNMGVNGIVKGTYELLWLDTETGETVVQRKRKLDSGRNLLQKPATIGNEVALHIRKVY